MSHIQGEVPYQEAKELYLNQASPVSVLKPGDFFMTGNIDHDTPLYQTICDLLVKAGCDDTRFDIEPSRYLYFGWDANTDEIECYDEPLYFSTNPRLLLATQLPV